MHHPVPARRHARLFATAGLVAVIALLGSACDDPPDKEVETEGCVPTRAFFSERVWQPFMAETCLGCHSAQGVAKGSDLVLRGPGQPDFVDHNLGVLGKLAAVQVGGAPLLLQKAQGQLDHGGGVQLAKGSASLAALAELVERLQRPETCTGGPKQGGLEAQIVRLDAHATWRRATLALGHRLPTAAESASLDAEGEAALPGLLDGLMSEPAFVATVQRWYADRLLVERYMGGNNATNLLDAKDHPARRWYDDPEQEPDEALRKLGKAHVNDALAREPLSLIGWVLEQGRPFTEVLTAEHMVLDPLTARALGAKGDFDDPTDPTERRPVVVPGLPHAGVLTSPMVLNRFPTTPTNRNRHRARTVYDLFLGVDILRLGDRPIDPTQITDHNPTLFNPDCTVCHGPMDPVAGAFQNWDDRGRFRMEGWFDDMTPPGFGDVALPPSAKGKALRWLAGALAADSRFARGAVQVLATGLFGRRPLNPPGVDDPDHAAGQLAWALEDAQLRAAAEAMTAAKQDLRVAVRHLVLGPLFRLGGVAPGASEEDKRALSRLGADRWLTPEELDHKLAATIGPWADSQGKRRLLGAYRLLYGGIDAKDVIRRVRAPNGVMVGIARRMANEVACAHVAADFVRPRKSRRLFPHVERAYLPEDDNGFEIPAAEAAIRANLVYLHAWLLGERLDPKDDEISRSFALLRDTLREGQQAMATGGEGAPGVWLPWSCRARKHPDTGAELGKDERIEQDPGYVIRAWMAVVAALLQDHRFLHQ